MNEPDEKNNDNGKAETASGSSDNFDESDTTARHRTLKLEREWWPSGDAPGSDEDVGVDPYNTGRFKCRKC